MTENLKERARRLCDQFQKKGRDRGLLIAFEGPDGSGKTTQRKLFKEWLAGEGHSVVTTKWNSSKLIKPIIKARKNIRSINQEEFCLLHAADFRHRLENEVIPALLQGKMVVADRFLFTALAMPREDWNWIGCFTSIRHCIGPISSSIFPFRLKPAGSELPPRACRSI